MCRFLDRWNIVLVSSWMYDVSAHHSSSLNCWQFICINSTISWGNVQFVYIKDKPFSKFQFYALKLMVVNYFFRFFYERNVKYRYISFSNIQNILLLHQKQIFQWMHNRFSFKLKNLQWAEEKPNSGRLTIEQDNWVIPRCSLYASDRKQCR